MWTAATALSYGREEQWEVKESASCWWAPCETASVTENHLLPCHTIPEQSTPWGLQESNWARLKCSVSFNTTTLVSFIHLLIDRFPIGEWTALLNQTPIRRSYRPPPARRLLYYCVLHALKQSQLFQCLCAFVQPGMRRSQGYNTPNCFTVLQIITMTTSTARKEKRDRIAGVETLQCYRNLSKDTIFPMKYGLLVWSILV